MATLIDAIYGTGYPLNRQPVLDLETIQVDPPNTDVDSACFMMDVRDLPSLIGEIARPANRRVHVKDLNKFDDWLHVISDPVVVKVNAGDTAIEREVQKRAICLEMRTVHQLTLTLNDNSLVLSKNQVNVLVQAMVEALRACGQVECRVEFFGMKWAFLKAQPKIDLLVKDHMTLHGSAAVVRRNRFDIGVKVEARAVEIFGLSEDQFGPHRRFRKAHVHEMFNQTNLGSLEFHVHRLVGIEKIKIYQELCHEALSKIPRDKLDDMPTTMRTLRIRVEQFTELLDDWERCGDDILKERLLGTRIEITVLGVHTVTEARDRCVTLDLLNLEGIQRLLGGAFQVRSISIQEVLAEFKTKVQELQLVVQGRNDTKLGIRERTALTFARQALGWSGKNMHRQLLEARRWKHAMRSQHEEREDPLFRYEGWQQDEEEIRPLIADFLDNALWQSHSRTRDVDPHPMMLQKVQGGGYWKKGDVYQDRVGGARFFINKYGRNWRRYVVAR